MDRNKSRGETAERIVTTEQSWANVEARSSEFCGERLNVLTHALGWALSLPAAVVLLVVAARSGNPWLLAGCSIYVFTMVGVYSASTLSHWFVEGPRRRFFRSLDQAFIYTYIVGTYTPFSLVYLRSGGWWGLLLLMWLVAALGFLARLVWQRNLDNPSAWSYLLLGWIPAMAVRPIVGVIPSTGLWWVLVGGLCYTVGVVFLKLDDRDHHFHAIWHLFVLAGSAWHYFAILLYVVPAA